MLRPAGGAGNAVATAAAGPGPLGGLVVVRVADVAAEQVRWLWPGYLPRGKLVVLDGDPDLGKSTLTLDLAARVSRGHPMPDGAPLDGPAGVVLLTAEDGVADTVRPRLEAAGADLARVHVVTGAEVGDGTTRLPAIPGDVPALEAAAVACGAALVVVDVLNAFLAADVDAYRHQDVRRALHPLAEMAARTGAAVVALRHLSKSGGSHALYRGGGSIGIIGAARVGLLVAKDPDDEGRRVLAVTKSNLAALGSSLRYWLEPDDERGCARLRWEGTTDHRAGDLLAAATDEERSELGDACGFLVDLLASGPVAARAVVAAAERAGVSTATLRRAKARLAVRSAKVGAPGEEGEWRWVLPAGATGAPKGAQADPKALTPEPMSAFGGGEHLRGPTSGAPVPGAT